MDANSIIWPKHDAEMIVSHNEHKSNYETIEEWELSRNLRPDDWASPQQRLQAIQSNSLWTIQWYPNTPIGFNIMCGADLQAVINAALEYEKQP